MGGLIYPSIATEANDDNIALKCSVADSSLSFVWAHFLEISRRTSKPDEFTPKGLDFCDRLSRAGDLEWRGSFPNILVAGTDLHIDTSETALVLKDSSNRIIGQFSEHPPLR